MVSTSVVSPGDVLTVSLFTDLVLKDGASYVANVTAFDHVNLSSSSVSAVIHIDTTPPQLEQLSMSLDVVRQHGTASHLAVVRWLSSDDESGVTVQTCVAGSSQVRRCLLIHSLSHRAFFFFRVAMNLASRLRMAMNVSLKCKLCLSIQFMQQLLLSTGRVLWCRRPCRYNRLAELIDTPSDC